MLNIKEAIMYYCMISVDRMHFLLRVKAEWKQRLKDIGHVKNEDCPISAVCSQGVYSLFLLPPVGSL